MMLTKQNRKKPLKYYVIDCLLFLSILCDERDVAPW